MPKLRKNADILKLCSHVKIVGGGEMAYTRDDGVKIVPIGCLKD